MQGAEFAGERLLGVGQKRQHSTGSSDGLTGHAQLVGTAVGPGTARGFLDGDDGPVDADEAGEVGAGLFQKTFKVRDLAASLA